MGARPVKYRYTEIDLLAGPPYHYMYTPVEGEPFLAAYRNDRESALRRFEQSFANLPVRAEDTELAAALRAWPARRSGAAPVLPNTATDGFATLTVLREMLGVVLAGGAPDDPQLRAVVTGLARRFEVSKRLRSAYDHTLRQRVKDSAPVAAYAFLAFLLAETLARPGELAWLNALLKLNDHVISTVVTDGVTAMAARHAIRRELDLVGALAAEQGLAGTC